MATFNLLSASSKLTNIADGSKRRVFVEGMQFFGLESHKSLAGGRKDDAILVGHAQQLLRAFVLFQTRVQANFPAGDVVIILQTHTIKVQ